MAEHRRVEGRGIVGTGMAADPERVREVEEDVARKQRAWRNAPERKFGDVLETAPAHGHLEGDPERDDADDSEADRRKRNKKPAGAPSDAAMASAAIAPPAAPATSATPAPVDGVEQKPAEQKPLPRVPRDPREALLRQKLAAAEKNPRGDFQIDTPPTGSGRARPALGAPATRKPTP